MTQGGTLAASSKKTANGPEGASQTYNNASKLLASANEIDLSVSDYGGPRNPRIGQNHATINYDGSQLLASMGNLDSEDGGGELQPPDGVPMTSVFD